MTCPPVALGDRAGHGRPGIRGQPAAANAQPGPGQRSAAITMIALARALTPGLPSVYARRPWGRRPAPIRVRVPPGRRRPAPARERAL